MMGLIGRVLGWFRRAPEEATPKAAAKSKETTNGASEPGEAKNAEALALARDPALLPRFLEDLERMGVVGEESAKKHVLLACISRLSSTPMSLTIKAASSAGKNHVTGAVLRMLPPEEVVDISGMSATALRYLEEDLHGKVLMVAERSGSEQADYSMRTLESEGRLEFWITERSPETGRLTVGKHVLEGRPAIVETTTRSSLHPENETRRFDVRLDESAEQTRRILKAQRAREKGLRLDEESVLRPWRDLHRLLRPCDVSIPYAELIEFPENLLRARRDQPRLFSMIKASAIFHQYQRKTSEQDGRLCVEATLDDYEIAREIVEPILGRLLGDGDPRLYDFMTAVSGLKEFTVGQGLKATGNSRTTFRRLLDRAREHGWIVEQKNGNGKAKLYGIASGYVSTGRMLLSAQELEEKMKATDQAA